MGGGRASCATPPLANAAEPLAVADACRSENAKPMAPILHYEIRKCDASAPAGGQFDFHGRARRMDEIAALFVQAGA